VTGLGDAPRADVRHGHVAEEHGPLLAVRARRARSLGVSFAAVPAQIQD